MFFIIASFVLSSVAVLIFALLIYARWHYGKLEKMGIPVVKPHFFLGSTHDLYDIPAPEKDIEWMKQYGGIFGVYEGRDPQIFACDAEFIRLITVKDAQYFDAKRMVEFNDPVINEMPDFLPGEKWRVVRNTSTPAFSSAKLKMMNMPIIEATQDFVSDIKTRLRNANNGKPGRLEKFPIDDGLCTMLTDLVFRSCFSMKIADRFNPNNPYHKLVQDLMNPPALNFYPKIVAWTFSFPWLLKLIPSPMMNPSASKDFVKLFKSIMDERRKSGQKYNDVVDLCIEWENKLKTPEMKKLNITEHTLMCEAMIFFWVGQDQMSTILATMIYHLAKCPEKEKRLHEEISEAFERHDGRIQHEHLSELEYLHACVSEAARLHPFFYRAERVCTKPWKNEQFRLEIPKGMTVQIPIWAANRNPKYFENPDDFIPERFLPENKDKLHPYALTTFGHGPRNCPGKRFSMECMQLVSAYLLKDLKFELRHDSQLKFKPVGPWMFAPHDQVYLDVLER